MSTRTPELRTLTASRITAAVSGVTVMDNAVDPITAARIVHDSRVAAVTVAFARVVREEMSHDPVFRAIGELDVIVYSLDTVLLDQVIESILGVLLTDIEWRSTFERVPSVVSDYEYVPAGDVDVSAARIRVSCQWSETYPGDLTPYGDLDTVAMTTRPGKMIGAAGHVLFETDDVTGEIEVGTDILADVDDEVVQYSDDADVISQFDADGEIIPLDEIPDEPKGEPYETPDQTRAQ
jgi:hypothetical protein